MCWFVQKVLVCRVLHECRWAHSGWKLCDGNKILALCKCLLKYFEPRRLNGWWGNVLGSVSVCVLAVLQDSSYSIMNGSRIISLNFWANLAKNAHPWPKSLKKCFFVHNLLSLQVTMFAVMVALVAYAVVMYNSLWFAVCNCDTRCLQEIGGNAILLVSLTGYSFLHVFQCFETVACTTARYLGCEIFFLHLWRLFRNTA